MTDFTIETCERIPEAQRAYVFDGQLSAGQSMFSVLTTIINGTWNAGSMRERVQDIFSRTVPAGKTINLQLTIVFDIEEA